jgi:hypothetical protein
MIDLRPESLLFIEPQNPPTSTPQVDELTRKMAAALATGTSTGQAWRGIHECTGCPESARVYSSNTNFYVGEGKKLQANTLATHYLAFHRAEVPESELAKVRSLPETEAEPTPEQLKTPKTAADRRR